MLWHISGGFLPAPVSCAGHVALMLLLLISMVRRFGLVVKLFGEQRVDPCLGDGFVDFRCGATAGHRSNGLAVYFDRHSTLIGEGVREHEDLHAAGFELIGGGFGRASIKCGVAGLFLGELDGVPAPSAFWRKSRLPLSSTMHMVTCTFRLCASASAAAAIVLMAARFSHFLLGSSTAQARDTEVRSRASSVCMRIMVTASSCTGEMREWLLRSDLNYEDSPHCWVTLGGCGLS